MSIQVRCGRGRRGPERGLTAVSPGDRNPVECAPPKWLRGCGGDGWLVSWRQDGRAAPTRLQTEKPPLGAFCFLGGPWGPFLFAHGHLRPAKGDATVTGILRERLLGLVEPVLVRLGYELVDLEFAAARAHAVVRLFIDGPNGVGLEDCTAVSREVSALLDIEDPIPSAYTLEVSSPGLDRVLRTQAHFGRFVGERVHVELKEARAGRRRYTGKLLTVDDSGIALEVDQEHVALSFNEIGKARLAPN